MDDGPSPQPFARKLRFPAALCALMLPEAHAAQPSDALAMPWPDAPSAWPVLLLIAVSAVLDATFSAAKAALQGVGAMTAEEFDRPGALNSRLRDLVLRRRTFNRRLRAAVALSLTMLMLSSALLAMRVDGAASVQAGLLGGAIALIAHVILIDVGLRQAVLGDAPRVFRAVAIPAAALSWPLKLIAMLGRRPERAEDVARAFEVSRIDLEALPIMERIDRVLEEETIEMIDSVREFATLTARDIMTPRTELVAIDRDAPAEEVMRLIRETSYSRVLVRDAETDRIVGVIYAKETLLKNPRQPLAMMRKPPVVHEGTRLPRLLDQIRRSNTHIAVVEDEFGGTAGVVTLHDLFESFMGHLREEGEPEDDRIRRQPDRIELDGRVELWEVQQRFGIDLPEEEIRTIGGLVMHRIGQLPKAGDEVSGDGWRIRVDRVGGNRVEQVSLFIAGNARAEAAE